MRGEIAPDDGVPAEQAQQQSSIKEAEIPFGIPINWRWCRFGSVVEFLNGDRGKNYPNKHEYVSVGIPWINTGHIAEDGSLDTESMNFITREKFDSLNGGKIQAGDLVYCLRGATIGKTAFVEPYFEGAVASSLMIIRPGPAIDRKYAFYFLVSRLERQLIKRFDNGAAQPNLAGASVGRDGGSSHPSIDIARVPEIFYLKLRIEDCLVRSREHTLERKLSTSGITVVSKRKAGRSRIGSATCLEGRRFCPINLGHDG
jgi:hypothetical protein